MIRVLFCTLIAAVASQLFASVAVKPSPGLAELSGDLHVAYLHSFLSPGERQQFAATSLYVVDASYYFDPVRIKHPVAPADTLVRQ